MSKDTAAKTDAQVLSDFKEGMATWASAVEAHRLAPPDRDFAQRLAVLAQGASAPLGPAGSMLNWDRSPPGFTAMIGCGANSPRRRA